MHIFESCVAVPYEKHYHTTKLEEELAKTNKSRNIHG
jgi:hypothetical protein